MRDAKFVPVSDASLNKYGYGSSLWKLSGARFSFWNWPPLTGRYEESNDFGGLFDEIPVTCRYISAHGDKRIDISPDSEVCLRRRINSGRRTAVLNVVRERGAGDSFVGIKGQGFRDHQIAVYKRPRSMGPLHVFVGDLRLTSGSASGLFCGAQGGVYDPQRDCGGDDGGKRNPHKSPLWPQLASPIYPLLSVPALIIGGWLLWFGMWRVQWWLFLCSCALVLVGWGLLLTWFVFVQTFITVSQKVLP